MSEKPKEIKGRRWMLVINNPTSKESWAIADLAHDDHVAGLMWSVEHAHDGRDNEPANNTEHYHIFVNFKNPVRLSWLKHKFPRAHIELARKPALACCRYVAKDGFYQSWGNCPDPKSESKRAQQKAEDLAREAVVRKIRKGELKFNDLSDEQLLDTKLVRAAKDAASMTQGPMRPDIYICCFVSPTGWGKSYSVWETFQHVASVEFGGTQEWFLDAEQDVMLFDEFCGQVRAQKMLKYLDCYPISLPIKGGHRPCYWKLIFICSNTAPDEWYMKDDPKTGMRVSSIPDEVRKALYRRIGFPQPTTRGETHVYSEPFTTLQEAQQEMKDICVRLHSKIYPEGVPSPLRHEDPDEVRAQQDAERDELRQLANQHDINLDEEEARWDRDRDSQREQLLLEAERRKLRQICEAHGIDFDAEQARWARAMEIEREREEHELDDLPALEKNDDQADHNQPEMDDGQRMELSKLKRTEANLHLPEHQPEMDDGPDSPPSEQDPAATLPEIEDDSAYVFGSPRSSK